MLLKLLLTRIIIPRSFVVVIIFSIKSLIYVADIYADKFLLIVLQLITRLWRMLLLCLTKLR